MTHINGYVGGSVNSPARFGNIQREIMTRIGGPWLRVTITIPSDQDAHKDPGHPMISIGEIVQAVIHQGVIKDKVVWQSLSTAGADVDDSERV